jgi:hypothetical protein
MNYNSLKNEEKELLKNKFSIESFDDETLTIGSKCCNWNDFTEEELNKLDIEFSDPDEQDDFAKLTGNGVYVVAEITLYGKTEKDVIFYNHITEDWEFLKSYHAEIEEISDTYNTEDEAISVLEALEDDEDDFENADEELKEAYDDYVRNFKKQRNSYYGWCKNNNDNSFNKMYGNGEPKTFKEFCNDL